jgi:hypothetical protein
VAGHKGRRRPPPPPRRRRSSQGRRKAREPCRRLGRAGAIQACQGDPARPPPARRPEVRAPQTWRRESASPDTHTHVVFHTRLCDPGVHRPRKMTRSSAAEATGRAQAVSRGRGRPRKDLTRAALDQRRSPRARRLELTQSHLKEQSNARARVSRCLRFLDFFIFDLWIFFNRGFARSSRSLLTG